MADASSDATIRLGPVASASLSFAGPDGTAATTSRKRRRDAVGSSSSGTVTLTVAERNRLRFQRQHSLSAAAGGGSSGGGGSGSGSGLTVASLLPASASATGIGAGGATASASRASMSAAAADGAGAGAGAGAAGAGTSRVAATTTFSSPLPGTLTVPSAGASRAPSSSSSAAAAAAAAATAAAGSALGAGGGRSGSSASGSSDATVRLDLISSPRLPAAAAADAAAAAAAAANASTVRVPDDPSDQAVTHMLSAAATPEHVWTDLFVRSGEQRIVLEPESWAIGPGDVRNFCNALGAAHTLTSLSVVDVFPVRDPVAVLSLANALRATTSLRGLTLGRAMRPAPQPLPPSLTLGRDAVVSAAARSVLALWGDIEHAATALGEWVATTRAPLTELGLSAAFGPLGTCALVRAAFPQNRSLRTLDLSENDLGVSTGNRAGGGDDDDDDDENENEDDDDGDRALVSAAAALRKHRAAALIVNLSGNPLNERVQHWLPRATHGSVTDVDLSHTQLDSDGVVALAESLAMPLPFGSSSGAAAGVGGTGRRRRCGEFVERTSGGINSLKLCGNMLSARDVSDVLVPALLVHGGRGLTSLDLTGTGLADECGPALGRLLSDRACSLTALHLADNRLRDSGCSAVVAALRANTSLSVLNLTNLLWGNDTCRTLGVSLQHNTTLSRLLCSTKYDISEGAIRSLFHGLRANRTLTSLTLERTRCSALTGPLLHPGSTPPGRTGSRGRGAGGATRGGGGGGGGGRTGSNGGRTDATPTAAAAAAPASAAGALTSSPAASPAVPPPPLTPAQAAAAAELAQKLRIALVSSVSALGHHTLCYLSWRAAANTHLKPRLDDNKAIQSRLAWNWTWLAPLIAYTRANRTVKPPHSLLPAAYGGTSLVLPAVAALVGDTFVSTCGFQRVAYPLPPDAQCTDLARFMRTTYFQLCTFGSTYAAPGAAAAAAAAVSAGGATTPSKPPRTPAPASAGRGRRPGAAAAAAAAAAAVTSPDGRAPSLAAVAAALAAVDAQTGDVLSPPMMSWVGVGGGTGGGVRRSARKPKPAAWRVAGQSNGDDDDDDDEDDDDAVRDSDSDALRTDDDDDDDDDDEGSDDDGSAARAALAASRKRQSHRAKASAAKAKSKSKSKAKARSKPTRRA